MKRGITAGTFDLLHPGHVLMLKEAKTVCDHLIVCVMVDPTIDRDWKNKPVQSIRERIIQLEGCRYVDQIIVYSTEKELLEILLLEKPDIRILGEEYLFKEFTGKELRIPIHLNSQKHTYSSTELRKRIKNL